jgi:molybdenum cofactor cytidylyltransferase
MDFGEEVVTMALGAILAHSVALPKGRLRKGITLGAPEIATLLAAGIERVTVARLGAQDVHEDAAALALARALVPEPEAAGLVLRAMGTGRVNILAAQAGITRLNPAQIHALNATHPMITLATVPQWHRMDPGDMVGTVKIISYGVPQTALTKACAEARNGLSLCSAKLQNVVLLQTIVGADDGEKGQHVTKARVARLGARLGPKTLVPHEIDDLAQAIAAQMADLILILTGSATSDAADTAPEALRRAGGRLIHFGMPVDPGNLLFIGEINGCPVIGLPGCARSPALNGADWVLERMICGVPVTGADIAAMGVGGLLKEIPSRPKPRES